MRWTGARTLTFSEFLKTVSTTHCKSGATAAVGLFSSGGNTKAVNWKMVAIIFFGWILTLPAAGTNTHTHTCGGVYIYIYL